MRRFYTEGHFTQNPDASSLTLALTEPRTRSILFLSTRSPGRRRPPQLLAAAHSVPFSGPHLPPDAEAACFEWPAAAAWLPSAGPSAACLCTAARLWAAAGTPARLRRRTSRRGGRGHSRRGWPVSRVPPVKSFEFTSRRKAQYEMHKKTEKERERESKMLLSNHILHSYILSTIKTRSPPTSCCTP